MYCRIIIFLTICIFSVSYGQDTLAVIDRKYGSQCRQVLIQGDSALIVMSYVANNLAFKGSDAAWYVRGKKVADVDLSTISVKQLLGIQKYHDTIYFYGYNSKGYKTSIEIAMSVGTSQPLVLKEQVIDGSMIYWVQKRKDLLAATLDRKGEKFRSFRFQRGTITPTGELPYTWDLDNVTDLDFLIGNSFKVYLDDTTLGVVYDDSHPDPTVPRSYRKTVVIRKNLITGKQDNDGFRAPDEIYRSAMSGNKLYRLFQTKTDWKIVVQDLDSNKVVHEFVLPFIDATYVKHNTDKIKQEKIESKLPDYRKNPQEININISDFGEKKLIGVRFTSYLATKVHAVGLVTGIGPAAHVYYYSVNNYFIGTTEKGFAPVNDGDRSAQLIMEQFENSNFDVNYKTADHFYGNNYIVGVYSIAEISRYTFIKFNSTP